MKILYIYLVLFVVGCACYALLGWRHNRNKMRYMSEDDNDLIVHHAIIEVAKKEEER